MIQEQPMTQDQLMQYIADAQQRVNQRLEYWLGRQEKLAPRLVQAEGRAILGEQFGAPAGVALRTDAGSGPRGPAAHRQGLVDGGDRIRRVSSSDVGGILHQGGTVLGTARDQAHVMGPDHDGADARTVQRTAALGPIAG